MLYLPRSEVIGLVRTGITDRVVLDVTYEHTDKTEVVRHQLAPFDIGSTNPKTAARSADALWAYCFTHLDENGRHDPKVCRFDVNHFVEMQCADEHFDELELTLANLRATGYDYRGCRFALLPDRDWYKV